MMLRCITGLWAMWKAPVPLDPPAHVVAKLKRAAGLCGGSEDAAGECEYLRQALGL